MLTQILIGILLTLSTIVIASLGWWALETQIHRYHNWTRRPPHGPKLMLVLVMSLTWNLLILISAVLLWAVAYLILDIFTTFEAATYFSLVAFTTLGFGDILLPPEWRLLGGMAAGNGLLLFGLITAILVETLRDTRQRQRKD